MHVVLTCASFMGTLIHVIIVQQYIAYVHHFVYVCTQMEITLVLGLIP